MYVGLNSNKPTVETDAELSLQFSIQLSLQLSHQCYNRLTNQEVFKTNKEELRNNIFQSINLNGSHRLKHAVACVSPLKDECDSHLFLKSYLQTKNVNRKLRCCETHESLESRQVAGKS